MRVPRELRATRPTGSESRRLDAAVRAYWGVQAWTCQLCGLPINPIKPGQPWDIDHITPIILGGSLDGPTHPAHARCNRSRGASIANRVRSLGATSATPAWVLASPAMHDPCVPDRLKGGQSVTFRFDISPSSVVVVCSECGWRDMVTGGRAQADQSAHRHALRAHPGDHKMTNQLITRKRRSR